MHHICSVIYGKDTPGWVYFLFKTYPLGWNLARSQLLVKRRFAMSRRREKLHDAWELATLFLQSKNKKQLERWTEIPVPSDGDYHEVIDRACLVEGVQDWDGKKYTKKSHHFAIVNNVDDKGVPFLQFYNQSGDKDELLIEKSVADIYLFPAPGSTVTLADNDYVIDNVNLGSLTFQIEKVQAVKAAPTTSAKQEKTVEKTVEKTPAKKTATPENKETVKKSDPTRKRKRKPATSAKAPKKGILYTQKNLAWCSFTVVRCLCTRRKQRNQESQKTTLRRRLVKLCGRIHWVHFGTSDPVIWKPARWVPYMIAHILLTIYHASYTVYPYMLRHIWLGICA